MEIIKTFLPIAILLILYFLFELVSQLLSWINSYIDYKVGQLNIKLYKQQQEAGMNDKDKDEPYSTSCIGFQIDSAEDMYDEEDSNSRRQLQGVHRRNTR